MIPWHYKIFILKLTSIDTHLCHLRRVSFPFNRSFRTGHIFIAILQMNKKKTFLLIINRIGIILIQPRAWPYLTLIYNGCLYLINLVISHEHCNAYSYTSAHSVNKTSTEKGKPTRREHPCMRVCVCLCV